MKNTVLFLLVLFLAFASPVFSQENTEVGVDVDTETIQYQQQTGGTQTLIQKSYGSDKIQHSISAQVDPDFLHISPMSPGERRVWQEVYQYLDGQLYTKEEMQEIEEKGDFIIQWTGKPLCIEDNNDPAKILKGIPIGENDVELWSVWMETAKNSFAKEDIIRMISKVRNKTHARRYTVTIEVQLNPQAGGKSIGVAGGASWIPSNTAYAAGVGPMIGKSESRVFKVYHITVTGYNDGSKASRFTPSTKASPPKSVQDKKADNPWLIYLDDNFLFQEPKGIPYNVEWIKRNWDKIRQVNGKINVICKGWPGSEKKLEDKALESMIEMGKRLISQDFSSAKDLEQIMKYGYDTNLSVRERAVLEKQNAKGIMILKITK